jgi:SAM-dependent methyltransferase
MQNDCPDLSTGKFMFDALRNYRTDPLTERYDRVKKKHSAEMLELLSPLLADQARILEVGPGHGHFAKAALNAGFQYDGIEPSDFFRKALVENGIETTAEVVPPIARGDQEFDLVYGSMFIENLPSSREAGEFASEAYRVLKPNGALVLIYPNYLTWGAFFFDEHYTHSFETTAKRIEHLLRSQGFVIDQVEYVLGWQWVRGSLSRNIVRHFVNSLMWVMHANATYWLFKYLGLAEFHWKIKKTFFEAVITIARRP